VAGAAAAEVVEAEVNDGDAAESLALHVLGLDGRRVGVLVAHPHPVLAAVVGGTVGVAAEPLGGIAHLAQRSVGALQVLVGRVGQLGAHLRPAEESGYLGLCAGRSHSVRLRHWGQSGQARVLGQLPGASVGGQGHVDLGSRRTVARPELHLVVHVELGVTLVQLVDGRREVGHLVVALGGLEVVGVQVHVVQVVDDRRNIEEN